jgi:hypothetical protein
MNINREGEEGARRFGMSSAKLQRILADSAGHADGFCQRSSFARLGG